MEENKKKGKKRGWGRKKEAHDVIKCGSFFLLTWGSLHLLSCYPEQGKINEHLVSVSAGRYHLLTPVDLIGS